ncbi:LysR family transcriptional regulator [Caulobacter sp. S45]|uniref:LysR family transcriptional regulator n=1 Tax=Caulobacter sp. S45 TaxID=1641861 RepID=UPI0015751B00|nr:LysR family transcriptional regulator [Caulobacter sp. S45]
MIPERLDAVSLRLLRLFEAVYRTRNISRAADELRTSQPSVSLSLGRLRRTFDDPLFVRVGSNMQPTSRAEDLIRAVRDVLRIAGDHFVERAVFDPQTSDRRFVLHMADPAQTILMPHLIARVSRLAPRVRLRVREIAEDSQSMLSDGAVDLIVGYLAPEADDLRQYKIHDEHYVCIARVDHPRIRDALSLERFKSESHIVTAIAGTGHTHVEPGFGQLRAEANIALEVSSYFAVGVTVAQTDLIAVVPSRLAAQLAAEGQVKVYELPVTSPTFQVRQYWHSRNHNDAGNQWIRTLLTKIN